MRTASTSRPRWSSGRAGPAPARRRPDTWPGSGSSSTPTPAASTSSPPTTTTPPHSPSFATAGAAPPSSPAATKRPSMRRSAARWTPRTRRGRIRPTESRKSSLPRHPVTGRLARTAMRCSARCGTSSTKRASVSRCFESVTPTTASRTAAARSPTPPGCAGTNAGGSTASGPCSAPRTGSARPRSTTRGPVPGGPSSG